MRALRQYIGYNNNNNNFYLCWNPVITFLREISNYSAKHFGFGKKKKKSEHLYNTYLANKEKKKKSKSQHLIFLSFMFL